LSDQEFDAKCPNCGHDFSVSCDICYGAVILCPSCGSEFVITKIDFGDDNNEW